MNPAKHDPPRYVEQFELRRVGDVLELEPDAGDPGEFTAVQREPGWPADGFDVLDEHGESLAFFVISDGELHLSSPSLDVDAPASFPLELTWYGRPVLRVEKTPTGYAATVPDRRVDIRVAVSVVVVLDRLGS